MHERSNTLHTWIENFCGEKKFTIQALAGDASFRRYFRLHTAEKTHVIMDSPIDHEPIAAWIEINRALEQHGLCPPKIIAQELNQGFLILDDFGDECLLHAVNENNADTLYSLSIDTMLQMQQIPTNNLNLPIFDAQWILQELQIMDEWFVQKLLSLSLSADQRAILINSFQWIAQEIAQQPTTFIHRDYHARNLMIVDNTRVGLIDFQDAMIGPITYDLVSLLKDCYIVWPESQRKQWLTYCYQHLSDPGNLSLNEFEQAFELCGLQRHLKVLGVFSRLNLRDQKPAYLKDLPRTFKYIMLCLSEQPALEAFNNLMRTVIQPRFIEIMAGI